MEEICTRSSSGSTPKKGNSAYYAGGTIPWLRTQDVKFNEVHAQIVFTSNLSLEMAQTVYKSDNVAATVELFYTENDNYEINGVIERCQKANQTTAYAELLTQTVSAYQAEHYHLACLGMLAVVDGVLSDVSENKKPATN